jgi:adhesin transport system membrane fusion protein
MTLTTPDQLEPGEPWAGMTANRTSSIARSANGLFLLITVVGLAAFLIWAAATSIEQVTKAGGRVIPTEQNQNVQHMEGGIISEILVKQGDLVKAGDPLLRVINSFSVAEMQQNEVDLAAETIRSDRLQAESNGAKSFSADADASAKYPELVANEQKLFDSRRANLDEQLSIFDEQVKQQQLALTEEQTRLANKRREYALMQQQVDSLAGLVASGAASRNSLLDRQSQLQQIRTEIDDLQLQIPQTESGLTEVERKRSSAELQFRSDAETDRTASQVKLAKLIGSSKAMQDRSHRTTVVAPIAGRINRLLVTTVGGVAQPGQTLLTITPSDASVSIEAHVSPKDRGDIYPGLNAVIKISAYDYSVYGGLRGKIVEISPDTIQDGNSDPYFRVRIEASAQSFGPDHPVVPGMMAEVNVLTGSNSVLDYLLKPLRRVAENAFRQ